VSLRYQELNAFPRNQPGRLVLSAADAGAVRVAGHVEFGGTGIDVSGSAGCKSTRDS